LRNEANKVTRSKQFKYAGSPSNRPRRPREGVDEWLYSFFNLGTRWGCVVNDTPGALTPGNDPVPNL